MINLSERLLSVAGLAGSCKTVADVGTDHGYIPVYLVLSKKAERAIAMDVNQGPLRRAKEHILQYGLEKQIETRLSDGCSALRPGEADVIVIAGMGGALMQRILAQGKETAQSAGKLVLQPQSEVMAFRQFLAAGGYRITAEDMVLEEGKYYPVIAAEYAGCRNGEPPVTWENRGQEPCWGGNGTPLSKGHNGKDLAAEQKGRNEELLLKGQDGSPAVPWQSGRLACKFGPILLEQHHPVLKQFLLRQQQQKQKILGQLQENAKQDITGRREELLRDLDDIRKALVLMDGR